MTQQFTPMYELIYGHYATWLAARPNYVNPKFAVAGDRVSLLESNGKPNPLTMQRAAGFYWIHICRPRVLFKGLKKGYATPDIDWEYTYNTNLNSLSNARCACRYELTERQVILLKLAILEAKVR